MNIRHVTAVVLVMATLSCVPLSLHPLSSPADRVFEKSLVGAWSNASARLSCTVQGVGDTSYRVLVTDGDGQHTEFVAYLTRIDTTLFLDLFPIGGDSRIARCYETHLVKAHSIYRVEYNDTLLSLSVLSLRWLTGSHLRWGCSLAHQMVSGVPVITAGTRDLRKFLSRCARTNDAFEIPALFARRS